MRVAVFEYRTKNRDKYLAYEKSRANEPKRIAGRKAYVQSDEGRVSHNAANARYRHSNQHQRKAHKLLQTAINNGSVIPWPVCAMPDCDRKPHGHHPDYDSPLDVVWLCPKHHKAAHLLADQE